MKAMVRADWTRGGVTLAPEHERAARVAIAAAGGESAFELVVVAGSLQGGHGHAYSDVDLYVIAAPGHAVTWGVHSCHGVPVQFNPVTEEELSQVGDFYAEYVTTPRERDQLMSMHSHLRLASRLAFGRVLLVSDRLRPVLERCSADVIRQLVMSDAARNVARMVEDAIGAIDAGDPLIAIAAAEEAAGYASEGVLAGFGDVYVGESFRWRRLARIDPNAQLANEAWSQFTRRPSWGADPAEVGAYVTDMVLRSTYLISYIQVHGWAKRITRVPSPAPETRRTFGMSVLRFGATLAIVGPDRAFRVTEEVARLWLDDDAHNDSSSPAISRMVGNGLLTPAARE